MTEMIISVVALGLALYAITRQPKPPTINIYNQATAEGGRADAQTKTSGGGGLGAGLLALGAIAVVGVIGMSLFSSLANQNATAVQLEAARPVIVQPAPLPVPRSSPVNLVDQLVPYGLVAAGLFLLFQLVRSLSHRRGRDNWQVTKKYPDQIQGGYIGPGHQLPPSDYINADYRVVKEREYVER